MFDFYTVLTLEVPPSFMDLDKFYLPNPAITTPLLLGTRGIVTAETKVRQEIPLNKYWQHVQNHVCFAIVLSCIILTFMHT